MNKKQFKNFLNAWAEDIEKTINKKECLISFLNRLKRANERQELQIVKILTQETEDGKNFMLGEKRTGTVFYIDINFKTSDIYIYY